MEFKIRSELLGCKRQFRRFPRRGNQGDTGQGCREGTQAYTAIGRTNKQLGSLVPCSNGLNFDKSELSDGKANSIESVVRGVIADEIAAINQYYRIIESTDSNKPVTQDLCTKLLADEEVHCTKFQEFFVEFTSN